MHSTDLGVFKLILELIIDKCKIDRKLKEFEDRWSSLGWYPEVRKFHEGVVDLSFITATHYRAMSFGLPFVLHNIFASPIPENVAVYYLLWRQLLALEMHSEKSLSELEQMGVKLQQGIIELGKLVGRSEIKSIKFHQICHWSALICEFGCTSGYNAETFEYAHKILVKRWMAKLNFRNVAKSIICRDLIAEVHRQKKIQTSSYVTKKIRGKIKMASSEAIEFLFSTPELKIYDPQFCQIDEFKYAFLCQIGLWIRASRGRIHSQSHYIGSDHHSGWVRGKVESIFGVFCLTSQKHHVVALVRVLTPVTVERTDSRRLLFRHCQVVQESSTLVAIEVSKIACLLQIQPRFSSPGTYFISTLMY